jgi:hypothetical protein
LDAEPIEGNEQRIDRVSVCDHDGKATGTLRLNPLRAEVTCDHCGAILQVGPPSVAVRFCDAAALAQVFRRAQAKLAPGAG